MEIGTFGLSALVGNDPVIATQMMHGGFVDNIFMSFVISFIVSGQIIPILIAIAHDITKLLLITNFILLANNVIEIFCEFAKKESVLT